MIWRKIIILARKMNLLSQKIKVIIQNVSVYRTLADFQAFCSWIIVNIVNAHFFSKSEIKNLDSISFSDFNKKSSFSLSKTYVKPPTTGRSLFNVEYQHVVTNSSPLIENYFLAFGKNLRIFREIFNGLSFESKYSLTGMTLWILLKDLIS